MRTEGPSGRDKSGTRGGESGEQPSGQTAEQDDASVYSLLLDVRRDYPHAEVATEAIRIDDRIAVFKATIDLPGGGKASGHGSEPVGDAPGAIERAETRALNRALRALGYGSTVAVQGQEHESDEVPVASAPSRSSAPARQEPTPEPERIAAIRDDEPDLDLPAPASPAPTPMPSRGNSGRSSGGQTRPTPVEIGSARERSAPQSPTPFPNQGVASAPHATRGATASPPVEIEQPPLEDYSWTAFWKWAREQGYESKGGIEAFIGRPMNNLNPAEVRQLIVAKRGGA